jgi:hypothetical protein
MLEKKEKKKRRWMKEWLKKRNVYTHENLLKDLRLSEPGVFQTFLRLDAKSFDELLKTITPRIGKRNTTMPDAIPPSQLQFFSELSTQIIKFFNQLTFISIQKSRSIFAKQIFVWLFFYSVAVTLALDIPQSR